MKTRIKVRNYADGNKTYQMQYKGLTFADKRFYLVPVFGWIIFIAEFFFWNTRYSRDSHFRNIDDAQNQINRFLTELHLEKMEAKANKKVKTEYIKYP